MIFHYLRGIINVIFWGCIKIKIEKLNLWENTPGLCEEIPTLTAYIPENKKSDSAIIVCPGGGYGERADYEGSGYAEFLAQNGYCAFSLDYRVFPHQFPLPLLDARRAVRLVRYYSKKYGIDKNKIAMMGSSAGAHLTAITSTYYEPIEFEGIDEIDKEDFVPNAQILCYPVIKLLGKGLTHFGSGKNFLGDKLAEMGEDLSPDIIATKKAPRAFIWHTAGDQTVNVTNSIDYAKKLKQVGVSVECHIFPDGVHGLALCDKGTKIDEHVGSWKNLLFSWLEYSNF